MRTGLGRGAPAGWALAMAALLGGCAGADVGPRRTLDFYVGAVQSSDAARLATFSAEYQDAARGLDPPAARAALDAFILRTEARLAAYEAAKTTGQLELGPDGVGLIKGLVLGRGVFFLLREVAVEGDRARVRMEVSTQYNYVPFENYAEGTRIFLMGMPLGRLLGPVRGERKGEKIEVLAQVDIEWQIEPALDPKHPTGWVVRSVEAVPGTARAGTVEWR